MPKLEFLNYDFFISKKNKYLQLVIIACVPYILLVAYILYGSYTLYVLVTKIVIQKYKR